MLINKLVQKIQMHKRARLKAACALHHFLCLIESGHPSERQLRYWMRYKRRTRSIGYEHISPWRSGLKKE